MASGIATVLTVNAILSKIVADGITIIYVQYFLYKQNQADGLAERFERLSCFLGGALAPKLRFYCLNM